MKLKINLLLFALLALDFCLSGLTLFDPGKWVQLMHGSTVADPLGLVPRMGAGWAAFFLIQLIAFLRWERRPDWLAVVAGVRFTELFCDWVYLYFADSISSFGRIGLALSPPVNLLAGWYLLRAFRRLNRGQSSS